MPDNAESFDLPHWESVLAAPAVPNPHDRAAVKESVAPAAEIETLLLGLDMQNIRGQAERLAVREAATYHTFERPDGQQYIYLGRTHIVGQTPEPGSLGYMRVLVNETSHEDSSNGYIAVDDYYLDMLSGSVCAYHDTIELKDGEWGIDDDMLPVISRDADKFGISVGSGYNPQLPAPLSNDLSFEAIKSLRQDAGAVLHVLRSLNDISQASAVPYQ